MQNINQPSDSFNGSLRLEWDGSFSTKYAALFEKAQKFVDNECIRLMTPYTPMLTGVLYKSPTLGKKESGKIIYNVPYARYQYYGKLMVSSVTGSPYAKSGEKKVLTDIDLNYNTSQHPMAGAFWFERMKKDHADEIKQGANKILGGRIR